MRIALEKRSSKVTNTSDMNDVNPDFNLYVRPKEEKFLVRTNSQVF